jgi:hypothetical protein
MPLQTQQRIFEDGSHEGRLRTSRANVRTRAEKLLWEYSVVRYLHTSLTSISNRGGNSTFWYSVE